MASYLAPVLAVPLFLHYSACTAPGSPQIAAVRSFPEPPLIQPPASSDSGSNALSSRPTFHPSFLPSLLLTGPARPGHVPDTPTLRRQAMPSLDLPPGDPRFPSAAVLCQAPACPNLIFPGQPGASSHPFRTESLGALQTQTHSFLLPHCFPTRSLQDASSSRPPAWKSAPHYRPQNSVCQERGARGGDHPKLPGSISLRSSQPSRAPRVSAPSAHRPAAAQTYLRVAKWGAAAASAPLSAGPGKRLSPTQPGPAPRRRRRSRRVLPDMLSSPSRSAWTLPRTPGLEGGCWRLPSCLGLKADRMESRRCSK